MESRKKHRTFIEYIPTKTTFHSWILVLSFSVIETSDMDLNLLKNVLKRIN